MGRIGNLIGAAVVAASVFYGADTTAGPSHGIAMYGDPALPHDFVSLPYVNPDAPKGGRIVFGEAGGFDSLHPFILRGNAPYGISVYVFETLMGRNWDEPFALYGLLAESVEVPEDRSWVEFALRPEARFSDGTPVTVDDVIWSFETLGTLGHPRYHAFSDQVASIEPVGERSVRITFDGSNRELALLAGLRPILPKAQWEGRAFDESGIDLIPMGSGPYMIDRFEAGRFISLRRNPDYWGRNLPFMRGQANFDEIRYDYFGDGGVVFEAFKAGETTSYREGNAQRWETQYDFPRVQSGEVVKSIIPHQRPSGITGYVMNTRKAAFTDWRVREAMIHAFNFEFINQVLNGGTQPRITSYFSNSLLGMESGPARGRVREILVPWQSDLLPGAIEGYDLPVGDGTERNRANVARAIDLMAEAGWTVQDGRMRNADGQDFTFEILLNQGATETQQTVDMFSSALARMGITPRITTVDSAQYIARTDTFDFDMAYYTRGVSLSPGTEQRLYWSRLSAETPGSRNWMGASNPAIDGLIDAMLAAPNREDFIAATQALDRVLTTGRYVIPIWFSNHSRLAHDRRLKYPERLPIYGDWIGFQPDVWWYEE
jgi:peptide/nickel transport system substrate-binding protein